MMIEKIKTILDTGHVAALFLGALLAAGVAYGRGAAQMDEHERRIVALEDAHTIAMREMRVDMAERFNRLEDRINAMASRRP